MREKDRCKKCKGAKVVNEKKVMEIFIEKGMRNGEKIPMKGEADQLVRMDKGGRNRIVKHGHIRGSMEK